MSSDQRTIAGAQTATAAKVSEAMEAAIRTLLKERKKDRDNDKSNESQPDQPYEPTNADVSQYQNYYEAYRSRGVDEPTAKAAAADATLGYGANDSDNIRQAHEQIEKAAQQAKDYRVAVDTAANEAAPMDVRRKALKKSGELAAGLGFQGRSPKEIADTISRLDPTPSQPQQSEIQIDNMVSGPSEKEALRQNYQDAYEQQGARPTTAQAASYETVEKEAAAADGPAVQRAHDEIRQHNILKDMYRGVYEKSGVLPEVAERAAEQMARGNGANRSESVKQAHDQALSNIKESQNISPETVQTHTSPERKANRSPEAQTPAEPKSVQNSQPASAPQIQKPILESDRAQSSETPVQPSESQASDSLWQQHSPTEQGTKLRPEINYDDRPEINDAHFAYNALSSGATVEDVKNEILRNSSEANSLEQPAAYADRIIARAEKEITSSQETAEPISSAGPVDELNQPPSPAEPVENRGIVVESYGVQQPAPKLTSQELYSKFSKGQGSGVFAAVTKSELRLKDLETAQKALIAGYKPAEVRAAIAESSPHATNNLKGPQSYAKRTVNIAQQTASFQQKAPNVIWTKYQPGPKQEAPSDKALARQALEAGYEPKYISQAISQNSPTAQQTPDPDQYGKTTVSEARQELAKDNRNTKLQKKSAQKQHTDQKPSTEKKASKQKSQTKKKSTSRKKAQKKDRSISM